MAPLNTREGFPTNALFGYVRMLLKLLTAADSNHVAVVFDAGRQTFRTELYKEYKANREECPAELKLQMPFFRELSSALGLQILEKPGFEADDILGTLTRRLASEGIEVVLVSGDKDLMQLVGPHVSIWDTMNDRRFHDAEVKEKFGVPPSQVVEVLGLMGDSSDNVPGLDGVGPKTAAQLVEKFGNVEQIIAAVDAIEADSSIRNRRKIADNIRTNSELLRLCRKLVEIDCAVSLDLIHNGAALSIHQAQPQDLFAALERQAVDGEKLGLLAEKLEFTSLLRDLKLTPKKVHNPNQHYKTILRDSFPAFAEELAQQGAFALDTETSSLNVQDAQLVGASFCWSDEVAYYVPLKHAVAEGEPQISWQDFATVLGPILANPKQKKYGQNIKYDIEVLAEHGLEVAGAHFDTMLASYLINPDKGSHNLTVLAADFLQRSTIEFDEVLAGRGSFAEVPLLEATQYAAQDAHYVWLLQKILAPQLSEKGLDGVFSQIEMPLVPVLAAMERRGVRLDVPKLDALAEEFGKQLETIEADLFTLAGGKFNSNSPKQLAEILFTKLGLPTKGVRKTKTGFSTDSDVLERLSPLHPLPAQILRYRTIYKLKSTYIEVLRTQVSNKTKRLHARFNQAVTGTGRLSSSDPNLQNIPIQTAEGRRIRAAFIAEPGCRLISADYSQIELRVLAHLSGDENLISAFAENVDIHAKTAREIMGLASNEQISPEIRRMGKTINFGVIYGMGPYRLSKDLGIPVPEAQRYIDNYFDRYPKVRAYFAELEKTLREKGYVETFYGRKRFGANIDASERDQGFLLRAALNAPLQGTAADLMKLAMIRVDSCLKQRGLKAQLIMQIHDEIVVECEQTQLTECIECVKGEMEHVAEFRVPLEVEVGSGFNWEEAHA